MTPDKLTAFIADGEDSFVAFILEGKVFPAVTASKNAEMIAAMERAMRIAAQRTGKTIRKYEFTERRELGVVSPDLQ